MHIAKRSCVHRASAPAQRHSGPALYRLRTREWDFFVTSEVEAFAVLSRHDVEDVELLGGG